MNGFFVALAALAVLAGLGILAGLVALAATHKRALRCDACGRRLENHYKFCPYCAASRER